VLRLGVAVVLALILPRSFQPAPAGQDWSVLAIVASGLVMLLAARYFLRSPFFQVV
jgi:hypothetical protein